MLSRTYCFSSRSISTNQQALPLLFTLIINSYEAGSPTAFIYCSKGNISISAAIIMVMIKLMMCNLYMSGFINGQTASGVCWPNSDQVLRQTLVASQYGLLHIKLSRGLYY